jgi:putative N-acetylmannosamine-6-phosphate epimerase
MITNDMRIKRTSGIAKVMQALEKGKGQTILSTGITGDDARMAKAAVDAGASLLEPNHPAFVLARGYKGITSMHDAEQVRHEVTIRQMAELTQGIRNVVGNDIYITVGIPGGFTELAPTPLHDEDFLMMSRYGADGLHVHKSDLGDLQDIVRKAHEYGLLVDAYIAHPTDAMHLGIPAETPDDVAKIAKQMEAIGVDMIGLLSGMSYAGLKSGTIHPEMKERLCALAGAVKVPTLAEGGINRSNFNAFKETGINIMVIGTAIDKMLERTVKDIIGGFLG